MPGVIHSRGYNRFIFPREKRVEVSLTYVFGRDREFQEFLRTPAARDVPATLRVRCVPQPGGVPSNGANGTAETPRPKPNGAAQTPAVERGSKA